MNYFMNDVLEKIEYMFWKRYEDKNNNYGYFGIGFMSSGEESDVNYPNTFFFRVDDEYVSNQEKVLPYSFMSTSRRYDTQLNTELKRVQKNIESQVFLHSFCLQLAKKML